MDDVEWENREKSKSLAIYSALVRSLVSGSAILTTNQEKTVKEWENIKLTGKHVQLHVIGRLR